MHFARVLNEGTNLSKFNKHLRCIIKERLVIRRGTPPPSILPYKMQLLRLCLSRGPRLLQRKLALWTGPNGDWRSEDIEVWVLVGVPVNEGQIAEIVAQSLQCVVSSSRLQRYAASRVTGADLAMDQVILLERIHHLAPQTWSRFHAELFDVRASQKNVSPLRLFVAKDAMIVRRANLQARACLLTAPTSIPMPLARTTKHTEPRPPLGSAVSLWALASSSGKSWSLSGG